jgi:hypothetical protein
MSTTAPAGREADLARLQAKLRVAANGCLEYTGSVHRESGYGAFWMNGRNWLAHRAAFVLAGNELLPGQHVLHSCDNRICCNQWHLRAGTHAENMRDMTQRGRQRKRPGLTGVSGQTFGRWTLIAFVDFSWSAGERWQAQCSCGTERAVHLANLIKGVSTSCGCRRRELGTAHAIRLNAAKRAASR